MLTQHQQNVYDDIMDSIEESLSLGQKFFGSLTGPAGTGKSFLTAKLIEDLLKKFNSYPMRISTPTHKSVRVLKEMIPKNIQKHKNFSISTIHSYLKLKLERVEDRIILKEDFDDGKIDKTRILIIDESSMVSETLFNHIKTKVNKSKIDIVLFVGDKLQLLPVEGNQNPVYEKIIQYNLTEVVRQAQDSPILRKATEIRKCIETKVYDKSLLKFDNEPGISVYTDLKNWLKDYLDVKGDKVLAAFTNKSVIAYNNFIRNQINGSNTLPKLIDNEEVVLQEMYEDNGRFVSNGDVLTVYAPYLDAHPKLNLNYWTFNAKEDDSDSINIRVLDDDSVPSYNELLEKISSRAKFFKSQNKHKEAKDMWDKFWQVKNMFVDIKYNYAHTVHKLQGSSYDEVFLNLNETINNAPDDDTLFRLVYVALTRARHKVYIFS